MERGKMMEKQNTVLVIGQSKPSREDAIYSLHGEFYICLIVERDTGRILKADCNTILNTTRDFVASMFEGRDQLRVMGDLEKKIRVCYFALLRKPLIACMKDACNRYLVGTGRK